MRLTLLIVIIGMLASCAISSDQVYKLYSGNTRPDAEIATLKFGALVHEIVIDGMKVERTDYGTIKLDAGFHKIEWGADFIVSVLVNSSGFDKAETSEIVELKAGHIYTINADRTTGHGYRMFLWITDDVSGETVAGTRKP
jgi:hypothetical protein